MKILIFNTLYTPFKVGGAEKSVQLLAEGFVEKGHEVLVVTLTNEKNNKSIINGVNVVYLKLSNIYWPYVQVRKNRILKLIWHTIDAYNPLMLNQISTAIGDFKPQIIHTNNIQGFSSSVWRIAQRHSVPIVHTLRDYYLMCPKSKLFNKGKNCTSRCSSCKVFSFLRKKHSHDIEACVGISDFILALHRKSGYFNKPKYFVKINNSVSHENGNLNLPQKWNKKRKTVGFLGRVEPEKGVDTIISAYEKLDEDVRLVIAGTVTEEYRRKLEGQSSRKIDFLGHQELAPFFNQIDILVVPSLWQEPFGRVVIESYMYGVPVISSDIGGLSELIKDDVTGYTFPPGNSGILLQKLNNILEKNELEYRIMSENCLIESKKYSKEVITDLYLNLFQKVIK